MITTTATTTEKKDPLVITIHRLKNEFLPQASYSRLCVGNPNF